MVTERAGDLRGFWGFANAMIGMVGGAERFIGPDDAEPEKPAKLLPASRPRLEHDENQPERLDQ